MLPCSLEATGAAWDAQVKHPEVGCSAEVELCVIIRKDSILG
jgi:hypothetical protein